MLRFLGYLLIFSWIFFPLTLGANPVQSPFITENKGQLFSSVKYQTKFKNATYEFLENGLNYRFHHRISGETNRINMTFKKAKVPKIQPKDKSKYTEHYYIGDISKKVEGVSTFHKLTYEEIYNGIDCDFYFYNDALKYDFIVAPNACVQDIQLTYDNVEQLELDEEGNLIAKNKFGGIKELAPITYQEISGKRVQIPSSYLLEGNVIRFNVGAYDVNYPLVIDPVSLINATYWSNSSSDSFNDVQVDATGNTYVCGSTVIAGYDAVIVKYDITGQPIWSTFFGGSSNENEVLDFLYDYGKIVLDANDNVYLTGRTNSTDLPILNGFQTTYGGGASDGFVAKFNSSGTLLHSSYIGGTNAENEAGAGCVALDQNGDILIGGSTKSTGFFNATGTYQPVNNGDSDGFILRVASDFSNAAGTYWGDTTFQVIRSIELDANNKIWLAGSTNSTGTLLPGGFKIGTSGARDAFILRFSNDLTQLEWGSYLGGSFDDEVYDLTIDNNNDVVLTGLTYSTTNFQILNAFQSFYQGGQEAFVTKISNAGQLVWSTYLGGQRNEIARGIITDNSNSIYVTGTTGSDDFPYFHTVQQTYNTINCETDGFIFKFTATGTRDWSTFYGGFQREKPNSIAIFNNQSIRIVGKTASIDLPTSVGAAQSTPLFQGTWKAFFSEFEYACPSTPIIIHSTENGIYYDDFWCNDYTDFDNYFSEDSCNVLLIAPPGYTNYQWTNNGSNAGTDEIITPSSPGSSPNEWTVEVNNGNGCSIPSLSIPDTVTRIRPLCPFGSFDPDELPHYSELLPNADQAYICPGESVNVSLSTYGFCGSEFQWQKDFVDIPNEIGQNYTITEPGCYRVGIRNSFTGCTVYSFTKRIARLDSLFISDQSSNACVNPDTIYSCNGQTLYPHFYSNGCNNCFRPSSNQFTYTWYRDGVSIGTGNSFYATQPGNYTVEITYGNCSYISPPVVVVIQPTTPPVFVSPSPAPICVSGLDSLTITITHPAAADSSTIAIYTPNGVFTGVDSSVVIQNPVGGCVRARITTDNGCVSSFSSIELHDSLEVSITTLGNSGFCAPAILRANPSSSCLRDSIKWFQNGVQLSSNSTSLSISQPGEYVLSIFNECGVFNDTVNVQTDPVPPVLSPAGPLCVPFTITATPPDTNSNYIYEWYNNPVGNSCSQNQNYLITGQSGPTLVANTPGFYYVYIRDTLTDCSSACSNIVEGQTSLAGATILPSQNVYSCQGSLNPNIQLTTFPSNPTFYYQWYFNSNQIPGANTPSYTTSTAGVYTVYIQNSCDSVTTQPISLFEVPNPVVTISPVDTTYICIGDTITVSSTVDQQVIYQWYYNGIQVNGGIFDFIELSSPGIYYLEVTNTTSGCKNVSDSLIVEWASPISATINALPGCSSACSATLTALVSGGMPPYQYQWSNGASTASFNGFCSGPHQLTVTDDIGCINTFTAIALPGIDIQTNSTNIICFGGSDGSIAVSATGGIPPYSYFWNTGASTTTISGLTTGSYSLTVSDNNGCSSSTAVLVTEPSALSISITTFDVHCFGDSTGMIQTAVSGGTAPFTFTWDSPLVSINSSALPSGQYMLTVTDVNACTQTATTLINQPASLLGAIIQSAPIACFAGSDGVLTIQPSGGTMPYFYDWNTGFTTLSISNLSIGTYQVTITDNSTCTTTASFLLTEPDSLMVSVSQSANPSCNGLSDGTASVTTIGGTSPYSYLWSNGQTTATVSNLTAGSHSITVSDTNNCTEVITINTTAPIVLTASVSNTDSLSCTGLNDGSIQTTVSGGTPPYSYSWSNGASSANITGLTAGSYQATISDNNGCTTTLQATVFEPIQLSATATTLDSVSCFGLADGQAVLNVTGGTFPYTYLWDSGHNGPLATSLTSGTHTATVTDFNGCTATTQTIVYELPGVGITSITADSVSCFGGQDGMISTTVSGGTSPYQYTWNNGMTSTIISNLVAGTYSFTATDINGCSSTGSTTVFEPILLSSSLANATAVSCHGRSDGTASVATSGGVPPYSYLWSNGETNSFSTGLFAGSYLITTSDANGCTEVLTISITEPSELSAFVALQDSISCFGFSDGIGIATVTGGTPSYSYLWDSGNNSPTATNLDAGIHTVSVTDANGCLATSQLTVLAPIALGVHFIQTTNITCNGDDNGIISVSPSGGTLPYSYQWSANANGQMTSTVSNLAPGNYVVSIIDWKGCQVIESSIITEPFSLVGQVQLLSGISCSGQANGAAVVQLTGGTAPYSYAWDSGHNTPTATNLNSGIHTVTVYDANQCNWKGSILIPSLNPLGLVAATMVPVSCFGSSDGVATVTPSGGTLPYYYSWNGGAPSLQASVSGFAAGVHTVEITDSLGCNFGPINLTVTSPTAMSLAIDSVHLGCWGVQEGQVSVIPSGGTPFYSYLWNTGATSSSLFNLPAGSYTVTVTDANGCQQIGQTQLNQPLPIQSNYTVVNNICFGDDNGSIEILSTNGGIAPYLYGLDAAAYGQDTLFTNLEAGIYSLSILDANSCEIQQTITLVDPSELLVDAGQDLLLELGENGQLQATTNSPTPVVWAWTPTDYLACDPTDSIFNCPDPIVEQPIESIAYLVMITDANGCTATDDVMVEVISNRDVYIPNTFTPNGDGINDLFTIFSGPSGTRINKLSIYDRWGELTFMTELAPLNDLSVGWDGSLNGRFLNPGVFVYYAEVEFIDGSTATYKGDVTLLR